jgi:hypothetical protein
VLENSAAQKKRKGGAGADFRSRSDRPANDGCQRLSGRGILASARVEHRGEALMLRITRILMRPFVKPRQPSEQHRKDEPRQCRAGKRDAENRWYGGRASRQGTRIPRLCLFAKLFRIRFSQSICMELRLGIRVRLLGPRAKSCR